MQLSPSTSASSTSLAALKRELKAWENHFRATHNGRDPTKEEIKNDPEIAAKYKLYQKSKTQPTTTTTLKRPSSSTTTTTSTAETLFQTPKKPRPSSTSTLPLSITPQRKPLPPKFGSTTTTTTTTSTGTNAYAVAHSPNKMRDLVASFSTRRSPNRKTTTTTSLNPLFTSLKSSHSPRKYNPFAKERTSSPPRRNKTVRTEHSTRRTRVDLGHLFSGATNKVGMIKGLLPQQEQDEDQEMLGESPVKLDSTRVGGKAKSFVSLFDPDDDEQDKEQEGIKNPFLASTSGEGKKKDPEMGKKGAPTEGWLRKAVHPTLKAVKRTGYQGAEQVEQDEDEEGDDWETERSLTTTGGQKGKKKIKRAPAAPVGVRYKKLAGRKQVNKKGSTAMTVGSSDQEDVDEDGKTASDRIGKTRKVGSTLIVDLDDEDRQRIVIRSTGEGVGSAKAQAQTDEEEEADWVETTGSLIYVRGTPPPPPPPPPLSSSSIPTTWVENHTSYVHDQDNEALPQELASILSLRSSPMKKTACKRMWQRDRTVDELLKGPLAERNKVKKGLMDLVDDDDDDEAQGFQKGMESDDDWASDVEGWKSVSDGEMDGYGEVQMLGRM